jgi:CxxC-x17-CxxC domain-containing protein
MENHRDDHIVCADCGTSFLFSAGEAAVFQERGLTAPKRCKECRRARKERGGDSGRGSRPDARDGNGNGNVAGRARGGFGPPARRYTGDVNEYRSPMQDRSFTPAPWAGPPDRQAQQGAPWAAQGPGPRTPRRVQGYRDGEYRAPSGQGERTNGSARGGGGGDRPRPPSGAGPSTRRRPPAEMFAITCNACGAGAEVPFKPAEGREVFCPSCYRARKPA